MKGVIVAIVVMVIVAVLAATSASQAVPMPVNLEGETCEDHGLLTLPMEDWNCAEASAPDLKCYTCTTPAEEQLPDDDAVVIPDEPDLKNIEIRANLASAVGKFYNCGDFDGTFALVDGKYRVTMPYDIADVCKIYWETTCQYGGLQGGWWEGDIYVNEHALNAWCGMSVLPFLSDSNILR